MTIKLPATLSERVVRLVKERNTTESDVVREAVEAYTRSTSQTSPGHAASALKGAFKKLPKDLSSNPKHLAGYGE